LRTMLGIDSNGELRRDPVLPDGVGELDLPGFPAGERGGRAQERDGFGLAVREPGMASSERRGTTRAGAPWQSSAVT
jgi:hypothetical protein